MGIIFNGRLCYIGGGLYTTDSPAFFRGGLPGISRTIKCDDSAAVVVIYED